MRAWGYDVIGKRCIIGEVGILGGAFSGNFDNPIEVIPIEFVFDKDIKNKLDAVKIVDDDGNARWIEARRYRVVNIL